MWRGHAEALTDYGLTICKEWIGRGYKDAQFEKISMLWETGRFERLPGYYPEWFGTSEFHSAHRSNLLRKNPDHYGEFEWEEGPDLAYVWPDGGKWPTYVPE